MQIIGHVSGRDKEGLAQKLDTRFLILSLAGQQAETAPPNLIYSQLSTPKNHAPKGEREESFSDGAGIADNNQAHTGTTFSNLPIAEQDQETIEF